MYDFILLILVICGTSNSKTADIRKSILEGKRRKRLLHVTLIAYVILICFQKPGGLFILFTSLYKLSIHPKPEIAAKDRLVGFKICDPSCYLTLITKTVLKKSLDFNL